MKKEKIGWNLFWSVIILLGLIFLVWQYDIFCEKRILKFIGSYLDNPDNAIYVKKYSDIYNLDWIESAAMIRTESNGKQYARNKRTGAMSYTQGVESTFSIIWRELKLKTVYDPKKKRWKNDYYDPESNIRAGLFYLHTIKKYYAKGDINLAVELYCTGVNNYRSKGWRSSKHMKKYIIKRSNMELKWKEKKILGIF